MTIFIFVRCDQCYAYARLAAANKYGATSLGRKNLSEERRTMILDAFEVCIARYGLEGTALDQVAKEVGFRRGLVRHYLGNREDMIQALAERAVARYTAQVDEMLAYLPIEDTGEALLELLFPPQSEANDVDLLVMENLIAAGRKDPKIQNLMTTWITSFVDKLGARLRECYPESSAELCWQVAYGLIGVYFNHESLAPLELGSKFRLGARQSARALLSSLAQA